MKKTKNILAAVISIALLVTSLVTVSAGTETVNATASTVYINDEAISF